MMNMPRSWLALTGLAALLYSLGAIGPAGWFLLFMLAVLLLVSWPLLLLAAALYLTYRVLRGRQIPRWLHRRL